MDILVDREYISHISSRLEGFVSKRQGVFNCRCPICGDSATRKRKKRFYFFERKGKYFVRCHNCGYSQTFATFLKEIDPGMHKQYLLARFKERGQKKAHQEHIKEIVAKQARKRTTQGINYSHLKHFKTLREDHPARRYVEDRCLPLDRILYAPDFSDWLMSIKIDPYYKETFEHMHVPVIVIPFWKRKGVSRVFQIRQFDPTAEPKYLTFKESEEELKIFGLDRLNPHKPVYVVEGPFDAMGLDNGIAFSGMSSELPSELNRYKLVFFLDNEPRNHDVVKHIQKLIWNRQRVVILDNMPFKDVNDMVRAGIDVNTLFKNHTYEGPIAQLKFNKWKKV